MTVSVVGKMRPALSVTVRETGVKSAPAVALAPVVLTFTVASAPIAASRVTVNERLPASPVLVTVAGPIVMAACAVPATQSATRIDTPTAMNAERICQFPLLCYR